MDRVTRPSREAWLFASGLLLAAAWLVPWQPAFILARGDAAFSYISHVDFARGRPWGAFAEHTTGPWGWLLFDHYHHDTFGLLLLGRFLIATGVAAALTHVAARHIRRLPCALLFVAAATWLVSFYQDSVWLFLLYAVALLAPRFEQQRTTAPFCVVLGLAALSLSVKGTFVVPVAALWTLVTVRELAARRIPWHALALGVLGVAIPLASGSTFGAMLRHLRFVLRSFAGYTQTFSLAGPPAQILEAGTLLGAALVLVLLVELGDRRRRSPLAAVVYAVITFAAYKTSFVRQDLEHVLRCFCAVVPFAGCYALVHRRRVSDLTSGWLMTNSPKGRVVTFVVGWLCVRGPATSFYYRHVGFAAQLDDLRSRLSALGRLIAHGREPLDREHERHLERIRHIHPIPPTVTGPVGAFGTLHTPLVAHGLPMASFPVAASYEVWSPTEVAWTVDFLSGRDAPPFLLLSAAPASARVALTMAERYEVLQARSPIVLVRRKEPRSVRRVPVLAQEVEWEQPVQVPQRFQRAWLVAEVDYRVTPWGTLFTMAYQPPEAFVVLHHGSAQPTHIRLNPLLSADGVALTPDPGVRWTTATDRPRHGLLGAESSVARAREPITAVELQAGRPPQFDGQGWVAPSPRLRLDAVEFVDRDP